ncbi:MAG: hypothetical protein EOM64_03485 [Erysipelotrichia bacterium]|nr:hypothetical protein [Erysipelotrichia bacterium]
MAKTECGRFAAATAPIAADKTMMLFSEMKTAADAENNGSDWSMVSSLNIMDAILTNSCAKQKDKSESSRILKMYADNFMRK